jgi:hypothetical protein
MKKGAGSSWFGSGPRQSDLFVMPSDPLAGPSGVQAMSLMGQLFLVAAAHLAVMHGGIPFSVSQCGKIVPWQVLGKDLNEGD